MKHLTFTFFLFLLVSCSSKLKVVEQPTQFSTVVKKGRVKGVIFKENGGCFMCLQDEKRFSPTIDDIQKAELIIKKNLRQVNESKLNQDYKHCPIIHKELKSYRRQYFGYIDNNGDKIIYATFNWDKFSVFDRLRGYHKNIYQNWREERIIVLDGCSYHWGIKINLNRKLLFELGINGSA